MTKKTEIVAFGWKGTECFGVESMGYTRDPSHPSNGVGTVKLKIITDVVNNDDW